MPAPKSSVLREDSPPDAALTVAKAALAPTSGFVDNRLAAVLAGPSCTRAKPVSAPGRLPRRADHDLVVRLCSLPPDLAAPLLRSNMPALNAAALLTVLAATGEAHHRLVAARRGIDWRVVKAVIRYGHAQALAALAGNQSIDLDDDDQIKLCAAAEIHPDLRNALISRPGLAVAHGRLLLSPERLSHSNLKLVKLARAREDSAFAAEIARRLDCDSGAITTVLALPSPVPLALAACALGLDRAVFLDLLRCRRETGDTLNTAHRPMVLSVFALPADEARRRLLALAS